MRSIGTLTDGAAARRLADYLLTLKIETRLEQQPDGWLVWVCDEDRVPKAREALAEFQSNPTDSRFAGAAKAAQELRLRELAEDEDYRERLTEFRERMTEPKVNPRFASALLVVTAVIVSFLTHFGEPKEGPYVRYLWIASIADGQLTQIAHGEVWRLITPIFIHLNFPHLLFNCLVVYNLAGEIERLQGSPRLIWLVFLFALLSNLAQFYLGHPLNAHLEFVWSRNPFFGGLSGIGYGLFGYVWMKSRLEPASGLQMPSLTVVIMVGWFFACLTGLLGPIANAAHAAGLALGLIIGAAPQLWQVLRNR
jgi:GlpG protein